MNSSVNPEPGCSSQPERNAAILSDQPKQRPNKLDQLTSEEIDKFISSETLSQYEFSGDRHLLIYDKNHIEEVKPESSEEPGDEFFELSKGEAQRLLRDIIRTRDQLENGQLMTKAMRDLNCAKHTLATLHQYSYSVVRLHLPNGHVLQALFKPLENIGKVKAYFRQFLVSPDVDFYIYFTPPKSILQDSSTLLDLRCVPTANFYFGVPDSSPSGGGVNTSTSAKTSQNKTSSGIEPMETPNEKDTNAPSRDAIALNEYEPVKTSVVNENEKSDVIESTETCRTTGDSSMRSNEAADSMRPAAVSYVRPDIVAATMVARSVADAKASEFRRARNPALNFMDETDSATLPACSKSPDQLTLPVSKAPRPRTSQDKIPKWFKPGK